MLLSAVSVLVVAQSIFEIPEGLMNNPVYNMHKPRVDVKISSSELVRVMKRIKMCNFMFVILWC